MMTPFKKIFRKLQKAFFLLVSSIILMASVPNQALAYSVSPGSVFNNPYGTSTERNKIIAEVHRAIENAPSGSVIRIATYSIKLTSSADRLIAAHKRGVKVQIITDNHLYQQDADDDELSAKEKLDTTQLERLKTALGTSVVYDGSRSFVRVCDLSCMSDNEYSSMHAKIYMFSTTGTSKLVSMISSSNLSLGHTYSWNNMYKMVGNSAVYDNLKSYFYQMARNVNNTDQYSNIAVSSSLRYYTFPRIVESLSDDVHHTMLEKVRCTGAASGHGSNGKTTLYYGMFRWTDARADVARKLR